MKISKITGVITGEFKYHTQVEGESFFFTDFKIEEGLTIPIQVSEYIKDSLTQDSKIRLTGYMSSCSLKNEQEDTKMFTFFKVCSYQDIEDDAPVEKTINIGATVLNIFPMRVANNGLESLTIVGKEIDAARYTSILHYTAKGRLARKLSATLNKEDKIEGAGVLHKKKHSLEILISDLKVVDASNRKEES